MPRGPVQYDLFRLVAQFTDETHPLLNDGDEAAFRAVFPGVDGLVADWVKDFPAATKRNVVFLKGLVLGYMVREAMIKDLDKTMGFSRVELHDLCGRVYKRFHLQR